MKKTFECNAVTVLQTADLLNEQKNITILTHHRPDGDTIGSAFALMYALQSLGKTVRVRCPDTITSRYHLLSDGAYEPSFTLMEGYIVAVDVGSASQLGRFEKKYGGKVDLCIDHHYSNTKYAQNLLLQPKSASCCEVILEVIDALGVKLTSQIANALYGGVSSDTGGFRFGNTTAQTHLVAARLIEAGARHPEINRALLESTSRDRMAVEVRAKSSMEYFFDGKCAVMYILPSMAEGLSINDGDLEGFANMPRCVEGVEVGVTIRHQPDDNCRISVRSSQVVNASEVCSTFGGGGHVRAAGCTIPGSPTAARDVILSAIAPFFAGEKP